MLIIMGGLPGSGKTTISKELARRLGAVHLRIDSIEHEIIKAPQLDYDDMQDAGYVIAYRLAKDNLLLGNMVIGDSVNSIEITRSAWRKVAEGIGKPYVEIETVCSDRQEHRARVEGRHADIEGFDLPTWQDVQDREYEDWPLNGIRIDTAGRDVASCVDEIIEYLHSSESERACS